MVCSVRSFHPHLCSPKCPRANGKLAGGRWTAGEDWSLRDSFEAVHLSEGWDSFRQHELQLSNPKPSCHARTEAEGKRLHLQDPDGRIESLEGLCVVVRTRVSSHLWMNRWSYGRQMWGGVMRSVTRGSMLSVLLFLKSSCFGQLRFWNDLLSVISRYNPHVMSL